MPRPSSASTASNCAGAISSAPSRCRSRRPPAWSMTAAISPACSTRRWSAPTSRASSSASARARRRASCAGSASAVIWRPPRPTPPRWAACASTTTARSPSSPARSTTARATPAPFAQVLTEKLGVPFERIKLLQGDSDQLVAGGGTGGSRSAMLSGTAIMQAADKCIEQGKQVAALCAGDRRSRTSSSPTAISASPAPTARSTSWRWPSACAAAPSRRRACRPRST